MASQDSQHAEPSRWDPRSLVNRLRALGLDARLMKGQRCILGSINLGDPPFETPHGEHRVTNVLFATLGIDRIKCLRPRFLSQMPPISILSCRNALEVEGCIRKAWQAHHQNLCQSHDWLEGMGIPAQHAEDGSYVTFLVDGESIDGQAIMIEPEHVILPSTGKLRDLCLASREERVLQIDSQVTTGVDLSIQISTRTEELSRKAEKDDERRRYAAMLDRPAQGTIEMVDRRSHCILLVGPQLVQHRPSIESLRLRGYRVLTAKNEMDAVEAFGTGSPELVISEVNLGRSEGLDLIVSLNEIFGIENVPVILVDQTWRQAKRDAARELGAVAYLLHPIDVPRIANRLVAMLGEPARRRFTRYPGRLSVGVPGTANAGLLTELSRGGMFVTTNQTIPMHSVHSFELRLPEYGRALQVQAEVIYHLAGAGRSLSGVGLRFHEFESSHEGILIEYLRSL